jgi:hypothetical protein
MRIPPAVGKVAALGLVVALAGPAAGPARALAAGASERESAGAAAPAAAADSTGGLSLPPMTGSHRNTLGIVASGAGVAAGVGLAVWLKNEADLRYDRYRSTADPARARRAFDAAQRYDRATLIGWTAAEISFVALFYYLTREEKRPLVPVRGKPLVRAGENGLQVGFEVTP